MKTKNYTKDEIQTALDLHKEGMSQQSIANIIGCGIASVQRWISKASASSDNNENLPAPPTKAPEPINKLLLNMACGNDLSKWVGRSITSLQPREIYEFLKAINLQGELKSMQTIKI